METKKILERLSKLHWEPVNLTPHPIVVVAEKADGSFETLATIPPSGVVARVTVEEEVLDNETSSYPFQLVRNKIGGVTGLPPVEENPPVDTGFCPQRELFIVSRMVLDALPKRDDVVAPDTGPTAYRDPRGHILGVTQFVTK